MRFVIIHSTDERWEAGLTPSPELIGRVGLLLREMARAGVLIGGEGLRATSEGVRVTFSRGRKTVARGPYPGSNELTDAFAIVKTAGIEQAIDWAARLAAAKGETELDIRPVTEPWDLGIVPTPRLDTQRYMILLKADSASEGGRTPAHRNALRSVLDDMKKAGVLVESEILSPSARGRRYLKSEGGRSVLDGPFTESKELIAGYVLFKADSIEDAAVWAPRYQDTVESTLVELREVEERGDH
jgi:hypothetical protein